MESQTTCPKPEELEAVLADTATPEAREFIEQHLEKCSNCAKRLEDLANTGRGQDVAHPLSPALREAIAAMQHVRIDAPGGEVGPADLLVSVHPRQIGPYHILERIGEGGMGEIYRAERRHPIYQAVAIKLLKPGMDSRQVLARFEAERQALAMMDHPNIAKILDAGATDSGRPYFVMELVRGIPITNYCDDNNLVTPLRLNLFMQVCSAIQHAHQKGIIHRDIKPSNILITLHDGVPVPKVIDFGIAKATQGRLVDQTLFTAFEQFIGTPAYMSPEQAEMSGLDIDTRSDIYSLGVLLYELLTGRTPFDTQELLDVGLDAMRRRIRQEEPLKPSTRLGTLPADALTTTAKSRHTDPPRLIKSIRGDLDWIAMRCLEKDRTRRYESASGLAADIRRHLEGEAVLARPATFEYRLKKFVSRHRVGVIAASLVVGALVAGTLLALSGMVRARHEQVLAQTARGETAAAFQLLRELMQTDSKPAFIPPQISKAVEQLDAGWLQDQPEMAAALRSAIGMKYLDFAPEFAERQFDAALLLLRGPGQPAPAEAADALLGLASLCIRRGDFDTADAMLTEALAAIEADGARRDPTSILVMLRQTRARRGDIEAVNRYARMEMEWQIRVHTSALKTHDQNELALAERSRLRAGLGQFKEAAEDLRRLVVINPKLTPPRVLLGYLELYLGNEDAYRTTARELFSVASTQGGVAPQPEIVRLGALATNPVLLPWEMQAALANGLTGAGGGDPEKRLLVRAFVLFRAGNLRMARDALQTHFARGNKWFEEEPIAELVMAMCRHRLGDPLDGMRWYDRALHSASLQWPAPGRIPLEAVPNYLAFEILRREAAAVLHAQPAQNGPKPGS